MYRYYTKYVTRNFPFVFAHRLEIPVIGGIVFLLVSIISGGSATYIGFIKVDPADIRLAVTDEANIQRNAAYTAVFFLFTMLITVFWLFLISRMMYLKYSIVASRYPIFTVIVVGAAFLNTPPFIFSSIAESVYHNYSSITLTLSDDFSIFRLALALAFLTIVVMFAVLQQKTNFYTSFISLICTITFFSASLIGLAITGEVSALPLLIANSAIAVGAMCVSIAMWKGYLRKHDRIYGISLFSFSFPAILIFFVWATFVYSPQAAPGPVKDVFSTIVVALFATSVVLNEITFGMMRRTRF